MDSYTPFRHLSPNAKLMVAFSGGIDSAVSAWLCKEAGFQVEAVNMILLPEGAEKKEQIQQVADRLNIPLHFLDCVEDFKQQIMYYCWQEFDRGRTPNPCAVCNPLFKFGRLIDFAREQGCDGFVTGHYARIIREEESGNGFRLSRGIHRLKDQSYFLFGLSPEQLAYTCMPLGNMNKEEVREIAGKLNLPNAENPESQDACFAPANGSLAEMLRETFNGQKRCGQFIDAETGKVLGTHQGIHAYTIGQRKGTGVAMGKPVYVKRICAGDQRIELTANSKLLEQKILHVSRPNFLSAHYAGLQRFRADVQIRYRSKAAPALVTRLDGAHIQLEFDEPQRAVTPGQAAVFYVDDCLIGGAWID